MSTPTYLALSKSIDALRTTDVEHVLSRVMAIMLDVPELLRDFATLEARADREKEIWARVRETNFALRAERDAARAELTAKGARELADDLLRRENDQLRAELRVSKRCASALYRVADRHAGLRNCRRCELPTAQGWTCIHCEWDSSDPDQLTDEQRKEWQESPEGQEVLALY